MYGVPQFAQAAARLRRDTGIALGTVFGAELSLDLPGSRRQPDHGASPNHGASPIPAAGTCWCWPATARGTGGCAG